MPPLTLMSLDKYNYNTVYSVAIISISCSRHCVPLIYKQSATSKLYPSTESNLLIWNLATIIFFTVIYSASCD